MKLSDIEVDPIKIESGEWVGDIPEMPGLRLKVRGTGCAAYRKLQAQLIEAVPRNRRIGGKLSQEDQDRITTACLHRVVLLDWEGLEADDDTPQPYDKALAETYLADPRYRKFRDAVTYAASIVGESQAQALQDDMGNSSTASAGISAGATRKPPSKT